MLASVVVRSGELCPGRHAVVTKFLPLRQRRGARPARVDAGAPRGPQWYRRHQRDGFTPKGARIRWRATPGLLHRWADRNCQLGVSLAYVSPKVRCWSPTKSIFRSPLDRTPGAVRRGQDRQQQFAGSRPSRSRRRGCRAGCWAQASRCRASAWTRPRRHNQIAGLAVLLTLAGDRLGSGLL
jgi:hypothetical protein